MKTILQPEAQRVVDRLLAAAESSDAAVVAEASQRLGSRAELTDWQRAEALGRAYLPVSRDVGQFLYLLARSTRAAQIVEFGTSFGVSAIHLASALRDNGAGRLVTTELHPHKVEVARSNLAEAGLAAWVEVREGDALVTLTDGEPIDMLLLDGWKTLYLPVLRRLEPRLRSGALIVADNLSKFPEQLASYAHHVRTGGAYLSVELPFADHLEVSLRC
jgi:predicted O-methyltransferase YrrM